MPEAGAASTKADGVKEQSQTASVSCHMQYQASPRAQFTAVAREPKFKARNYRCYSNMGLFQLNIITSKEIHGDKVPTAQA